MTEELKIPAMTPAEELAQAYATNKRLEARLDELSKLVANHEHRYNFLLSRGVVMPSEHFYGGQKTYHHFALLVTLLKKLQEPTANFKRSTMFSVRCEHTDGIVSSQDYLLSSHGIIEALYDEELLSEEQHAYLVKQFDPKHNPYHADKL